MKYSKNFINQLFDLTDISKRNLIATIYYWIIDSKERTRKRLDSFIKGQLDNPHPALVEVAETFRKFETTDEAIIAILNYVIDRVQYIRDINNFGKVKYWANAHETWARKRDDCDGINALIYILARLAGFNPMLIWNCIGNTSVGGHYWVVYLSPKTKKWYCIDGTLNIDFRSIEKGRNSFRFNKLGTRSLWFIFNEQGVWKQ